MLHRLIICLFEVQISIVQRKIKFYPRSSRTPSPQPSVEEALRRKVQIDVQRDAGHGPGAVPLAKNLRLKHIYGGIHDGHRTHKIALALLNNHYITFRNAKAGRDRRPFCVPPPPLRSTSQSARNTRRSKSSHVVAHCRLLIIIVIFFFRIQFGCGQQQQRGRSSSRYRAGFSVLHVAQSFTVERTFCHWAEARGRGDRRRAPAPFFPPRDERGAGEKHNSRATLSATTFSWC